MSDHDKGPHAGHDDSPLSEPLLRAVNAIRRKPLPADALTRALERARRLGTIAFTPRRMLMKRMYVLTALAASVCLVWITYTQLMKPVRDDGPVVVFDDNRAPTTGRESRLLPDLEGDRLPESSGAPKPQPANDSAEDSKKLPARMDETQKKASGLPNDFAPLAPGYGPSQPPVGGKDQEGKERREAGGAAKPAGAAGAPGGGGGFGGGGFGGGGPASSGLGAGDSARGSKSGSGSSGFGAPQKQAAPTNPAGGVEQRMSEVQSETRPAVTVPPVPLAGPAPAMPGARGRSDGGRPASPEPPAQEIDRLRGLEELEKLNSERSIRLNRAGVDADKNLGAELKDTKKDKEKKESEAFDKSKNNAVFRRHSGQPTVARVYLGNGNSLELISLQVSVTIEGPRARTVVDHIFRNPHDRQLEGTFEYPLPSGASPSYFAMFLGQTRDTIPDRFARRGDAPALPAEVARQSPDALVKGISREDWGALREARVVSKQKALETYEEIVRGRIDPALLEYAGGNTFSGRVFPIPPRGYNRVIFAYEELLPVVQDRVQYRFPLPDRKLHDVVFSLQVDQDACGDPRILPGDCRKESGGGRLLYTRTWRDTIPEGDVAFTFAPPDPRLQAINGRQGENGPQYVYLRVRPSFDRVENPEPFAHRAIFLLDTSLSEHPGRFAVNVKLMNKILESDPNIQHFNVLTFNTGSAWVQPKAWLSNDAAGREKLLQQLDGLVLEGATDLAAALDHLTRPGFDIEKGTPLEVFLLSDGQITWGESDVSSLVGRFEARSPYPTRFNCYRTGMGAENLELFDALTRKGGGIFNCFNDADLPLAATAHRAQCFRVENVRLVGGPTASDLLVAGRRGAIYPGGELIVAARVQGIGHTQLVVEGTYLGKKAAHEYSFEIKGSGELAPRGWAEIAVSSILALNDSRLDSLATAYCQQFGIASRVASFLVLENDNDYKRFNLEEERGKTVKGDIAAFLEDAWLSLARVVSPRESLRRLLTEVEPRVPLLQGPEGQHISKLLALLTDKDLELPETSLAGALVHRSDVSPGYLAEREQDLRNASVYLTEARRRADRGDVSGAVRVLSSVIEQYPARGDALRLVGYRLLDLKQPVQAVRLFQQVQHQRPFEPHSYRDLARSLEESGRFGMAALQYEILLAGQWHNRFAGSLKQVAQEEYARMMQEAIRSKGVTKELANQFGERLERMTSPQPQSDLRVTITWNTDATDVDLWVIEPDGTKCFYGHNRTASGGELSQDQTQGYGPERYQISKAKPGEYMIIVHYYRANQNLLAGETHVQVVVARNAGGPQEAVERHTVILKQANEQVEVCKVKF